MLLIRLEYLINVTLEHFKVLFVLAVIVGIFCVVYACLLACEYAHVCTHECIWSSMNIKHPAVCPSRVQLITGNVCLMQSRECHLILNSCDFFPHQGTFQSIVNVNILVWYFIWQCFS